MVVHRLLDTYRTSPLGKEVSASHVTLPEKLAFGLLFDPPNFVERVTALAFSEKYRLFTVASKPFVDFVLIFGASSTESSASCVVFQGRAARISELEIHRNENFFLENGKIRR
jgi:hypothetical protein